MPIYTASVGTAPIRGLIEVMRAQSEATIEVDRSYAWTPYLDPEIERLSKIGNRHARRKAIAEYRRHKKTR